MDEYDTLHHHGDDYLYLYLYVYVYRCVCDDLLLSYWCTDAAHQPSRGDWNISKMIGLLHRQGVGVGGGYWVDLGVGVGVGVGVDLGVGVGSCAWNTKMNGRRHRHPPPHGIDRKD